MKKVKKNIFFNVIGSLVSSVLALFFMPYYFKTMGAESYAVLGFFVSLQVWFALIDLGLVPTLSNQMAHYKSGKLNKKNTVNFLKSVEIFYILITVFLGLIFYYGSSYFSHFWFKPNVLPLISIQKTISLLGLVISLKLFEEVYRASISAMQFQIWLNIAQIILSTFRWVGGFVVILSFGEKLEAFFIWQLLISAITLVILRHQLYKYLNPITFQYKFSFNCLWKARKFTSGIFGISFFALALTQADKILLSGILNLKEYGYYIFSSSLSGVLGLIILPIGNAAYPYFINLKSQNNKNKLGDFFHKSCQWVSFLIIPLACNISFFAYQVIYAWTGDSVIAENVSPILKILIIGNLLSSFIYIPYIIQIAYKWTTLTLLLNLLGFFIMIPGLFYLVPIYGAKGAAYLWLIINLIFAVGVAIFMYKKILINHRNKWLFYSILIPTAFSFIFCGAVKFLSIPFFLEELSRVQSFLFVSGLLISQYFILSFTMPTIRNSMLNLFEKRNSLF
jgi:O-antigen/teichoic acid export membrane protein